MHEGFEGGYGEGMISVSMEELQTYAVNISHELKDSSGKIHHAWEGPAQFDPIWYSNDF